MSNGKILPVQIKARQRSADSNFLAQPQPLLVDLLVDGVEKAHKIEIVPIVRILYRLLKFADGRSSGQGTVGKPADPVVNRVDAVGIVNPKHILVTGPYLSTVGIAETGDFHVLQDRRN